MPLEDIYLKIFAIYINEKCIYNIIEISPRIEKNFDFA
jgi:hypothetical protein